MLLLFSVCGFLTEPDAMHFHSLLAHANAFRQNTYYWCLEKPIGFVLCDADNLFDINVSYATQDKTMMAMFHCV